MTTTAHAQAAPSARSRGLRFDDSSVAAGYDDVLVPALFESWAEQLLGEHQPWAGRQVLDLATGTGVVAGMLARRVGPTGRVLGVDLNERMLARAVERCAYLAPVVRFVRSPAHPLEVADESVDFVVCQQGFQFFPDKHAAAREIHRVLRDGGRVVVTTWREVSECLIFGAICDALDSIGETELADAMRVPFDHLPVEDLVAPFEAAGFRDVRAVRREQPLRMAGGVAQAIEFAYATPIGPQLKGRPEPVQLRFREAYTRLVRDLGGDETAMGTMASNELTAGKARGPIPRRRAGTRPSA